MSTRLPQIRDPDVNPRGRDSCEQRCCTVRATYGSKSEPTPESVNRATPSSASPRPASAGPTCGPTAASTRRARQWVVGAQAPLLRVPMADGTLVATPELPSPAQVPDFLAVSDVLGTG